MKNYKLLFCLLACMAIFFACEDERDIVPDASEMSFVFDFPQGDNSWDQDLIEIADRFDVQCIYTGIDSLDLNRIWTSSGLSSAYCGHGLESDRLKVLYTRFFKEHVFAYLNPQYVNRNILPNYIYFCQDLATQVIYGTQQYAVSTKMLWDGMGFWAFGWETDTMPGYNGAKWKNTMFTDAVDVEKNREIVLKNIFNKMYSAGIIKMPEEFDYGGDFDYTTAIEYKTGTEGEENYYKRRGFPEQLRNFASYASPKNLESIRSTSPQQNFTDYLWLAFRYTAEEIAENYRDFPLVIKYHTFTVNYMKESYGMDISKIAEPVTEDLDAGLDFDVE